MRPREVVFSLEVRRMRPRDVGFGLGEPRSESGVLRALQNELKNLTSLLVYIKGTVCHTVGLRKHKVHLLKMGVEIKSLFSLK